MILLSYTVVTTDDYDDNGYLKPCYLIMNRNRGQGMAPLVILMISLITVSDTVLL